MPLRMSISTSSACRPESSRRPSMSTARARPSPTIAPTEIQSSSRVAAQERPVDHVPAGDPDERDLRGLRADREDDRDREPRPVRLQEREQAKEDGAVPLRLNHVVNLASTREAPKLGADERRGSREQLAVRR